MAVLLEDRCNVFLLFTGAAKILITTNVALTLFLGLALFHILVVRYKDKKSLLHNNSWIFKEERIDYSCGEQINIVTLKQMHGYNILYLIIIRLEQ